MVSVDSRRVGSGLGLVFVLPKMKTLVACLWNCLDAGRGPPWGSIMGLGSS